MKIPNKNKRKWRRKHLSPKKVQLKLMSKATAKGHIHRVGTRKLAHRKMVPPPRNPKANGSRGILGLLR